MSEVLPEMLRLAIERLRFAQAGSISGFAEPDCARFVPKDVASGDLSDFRDSRISNLRFLSTG